MVSPIGHGFKNEIINPEQNRLNPLNVFPGFPQFLDAYADIVLQPPSEPYLFTSC
jgi:hypothetical protein